ncbi:MAG: hydantoinase B/oxoprolinase family protein [Acidobacteria bacterium]|nr:hydantoinase B/oxoprolinase family protein [Acidobacteriota bacterium]
MPHDSHDPANPIALELFTHRFAQVVAEMGELLQRTAVSVNVKERLDFSCALLDDGGRLVVNAPHIPVHLGALGLCVRRVSESIDWHPGDVVLTNHPGFGGSHLPDVTVITPVFESPVLEPAVLEPVVLERVAEGKSEVVGFVANRAHHAEIGGTRPGSMPPDASCLAEEGVVLPPTFLARQGVFDWPAIASALAGALYPSRSIEENLADLAAAVAANRRGETALLELASRYGAETVRQFMRELSSRAARGARRALAKIGCGRYAAEERLDDGSPIKVSIEIGEDRTVIDFSGSSGVHPGNLNATPGIVRSAVLYVLRLLIDEPLPLNEGLLEEVELIIPTGMLNPEFPEDPSRAPAVVGGNVETSQRIVDTLLKALRVSACSQGTMNNVVFGNESFAYYETIGGGAGAGPGFEGASGVHTHMTNTAITDPEILEQRYPVRLERFAIRRGSGGAGDSGGLGGWRGGDGLMRELVFLEPLTVSILSQHRKEGPYGVAGGADGKPGRQWIERAAGGRQALSSVDGCEVAPGDRLVVKTPGGGGWGSA